MTRFLMSATITTLCALIALNPSQASMASASVHTAQAHTTPMLTAVDFVDQQHGWVAGHDIFGTTDGGHSWSKQYTGNIAFTGIDFVNTHNGWAWGPSGKGSTPVFLRTLDGGQHWSKVPGPDVVIPGSTNRKSLEFQQVRFINDTLGFAVTASAGLSFLVRSINGGQSWQEVNTPHSPASACFRDAQHGWMMSAKDDSIFETRDGGKTWNSSLTTGSGFEFRGGQISCTGKDSVWALLLLGVGMNQQSYVLYYKNSTTRSWKAVVAAATAGGGPVPDHTSGVPNGIPGVGIQLEAPDANTAYLVGGCPPCGDRGETYIGSTHDGGKTWQNNPAIPDVGFINARISFPTPLQGWLIGSSSVATATGWPMGYIVTTINGGRTWQKGKISE